MNGLRKLAILSLLAVLALGPGQCSTPVVDNVRLDISASAVALRADFDESVLIDIGGRILIPDLEGGFIELIPGGGGGGTNAGIAFGVDLSQYGRQFPIAPVDSLPNGIPFPGTVEGPLLAWFLDTETHRTLVAYMGIQTGEIGFTAQLDAFNNVLLPGSLITLIFRDEETNEIVADITLYGPQEDNRQQIVRSGGVFVHAFIPGEFLPGGAYYGEQYVIDTAGTYIEVIQ